MHVTTDDEGHFSELVMRATATGIAVAAAETAQHLFGQCTPEGCLDSPPCE